MKYLAIIICSIVTLAGIFLITISGLQAMGVALTVVSVSGIALICMADHGSRLNER